MSQYPHPNAAAADDNWKRIHEEWDAGRPYPEPKTKTRLQMTADDLCAGNAHQRCSDALWAVAAELKAESPDFESCKRIIERSASLLS